MTAAVEQQMGSDRSAAGAQSLVRLTDLAKYFDVSPPFLNRVLQVKSLFYKTRILINLTPAHYSGGTTEGFEISD